MEKDNKATEANAAPIATQEENKVIAPTQDDAEARYKAIEEEKENYKNAYLKERNKHKESGGSGDETDEDKMRRIASETLADSRLADLAREQDALIKSALRENNELKLALKNKTNSPAASIGSHSESTPVRDTAITPEQEAYFKSKKWNAQDIERYKKNLAGRR